MSEAAKTGLGLDCYSEEELAAPAVTKKDAILKKFPGPDSPLICKLVPDLLRGRVDGKFFEYFEIQEHGHVGGVNKKGEKMIYSHPCRKSLGEKSCPECDRYWHEKERLKLAGEHSAEGKAIKAVVDLLAPRRKVWVYFVTPESDQVKAVKMSKDLMNQLWGAPANKYKGEIASLIAGMKTKGMSPYDLKNPIGWMKIYKTGEGLGTRYFAEVAKKEEVIMENGRPAGTVNRFVSSPVSEYLMTSFDVKSLVDFRKIESERAFTPDESADFAKTLITPQRVIDMWKKEEETETPDATEKTQSVEKVMASIGPNLSEIDETL